MIGGIVMFGVSYLVPAIIGGGVGSLKDDECDCNEAFRLMIPIAGPVTLLHRGSDYTAFNALMITDTILQTAGIVLTVFGIIRFAKSAPQDEYDDAKLREPRFDFAALPTPGGGVATLRLRL